jgi:hypothetical protein
LGRDAALRRPRSAERADPTNSVTPQGIKRSKEVSPWVEQPSNPANSSTRIGAIDKDTVVPN